MEPKVLIFDSGVGGLSILREIHQLLPTLSLQYLMDSAEFPYGTKPDEELIQRVLDLCCAAVKQLNPSLLVIACNTASTLTLPHLRERLDIPVVGVVPAIKVAAKLSTTGQIGLLATPATVNRTYTKNLIQDFAPHCDVRRLGSSELVQWAENWIETEQVSNHLYDHLNHWLTQPTVLSHVVLGCTHFPLLKEALTELWPTIGWVDSGVAIAQRVANLLTEHNLHSATSSAAMSCYWTHKDQIPKGAIAFLQRLAPIQQAERFCLPQIKD